MTARASTRVTSQQASLLQMTDKLRSHGVYGPTYTNIRKRFHQKLGERTEPLDPQAGTAAKRLAREEVQRVAADDSNLDAIRFLQGFPEFRCGGACLPSPCQLGPTSLVQHHCRLLPLNADRVWQLPAAECMLLVIVHAAC